MLKQLRLVIFSNCYRKLYRQSAWSLMLRRKCQLLSKLIVGKWHREKWLYKKPVCQLSVSSDLIYAQKQ